MITFIGMKSKALFIDMSYSLAALNLAIFISFGCIFVSESSFDSSSLSSFPKNLFNNLLEKFSAEFLRFSKTPFLIVKNKLTN